MMYSNGGSSDAITREMNYPLYSPTFKHHEDFAKIKALIASDPYPNYDHHNHNHNHTQNHNRNQQHDGDGQIESSLIRYRTAPSSFFANLLEENGSDGDDFLDPVHETEERFFTRDQQKQQKSETDSGEFLRYESLSTGMKLESREAVIRKGDRPPPPALTAMYGGDSRRVQNFPSGNNGGTSNNHIDDHNLENSSTFEVMKSTSSNLIRQSSSPAGFLSSLNAENGFDGIKDMGKAISSRRLNNHINFSSQPSFSPMFLPQISKNKNNMNDPTFTSLKRSRDGDLKMFSNSIALDSQNGAPGHYTPSLVHHMSLPKTSSEMATAEKFLRFEQEMVPCKLRAKRGHATDPRSIAERVRRTRISERMKKLQEFFPNMDKQTNIADMLDMAVGYIKDLQKEVQTINDARTRCSCSSKQLQ